MARLRISGLLLAVAVAACSPASSPTTTESSATTTVEPTTTTVPSLEIPVESAFEAFCTGMISATESFSDGMEGVEFWELYGDDTWFDCIEAPNDVLYEQTAERGESFDDLAFNIAYVLGCTIPLMHWDVATFGPYVDDSFPDTETRRLYNEVVCARPFAIAFEADWEWEILRSGVCYSMDFVPTDGQIESGMVPCP